jgi:hypothetical protein
METRSWKFGTGKIESGKWKLVDGNLRSLLLASLGFQGPMLKTCVELAKERTSFDFRFSIFEFRVSNFPKS